MKGVFNMKHTMLTSDTLTRFEKLVNIDTLTAEQISNAEHNAFAANMGADNKEAAWAWFKSLSVKYLGIDLDALEAAQDSESHTEPQKEPAEIDPAELLEDIDTGDHGDRLNDYRDSDIYIGDAVSEIADSDTSIYYSDILDFIRENPEALADVVAEGLYEVRPGAEYDLYKHGQAAEYMTIERDIYNHLRDAVLLCAVDFIRYDLKRETIPEELADLLQEWADKADNNDRMNEIPDKIREYFGNAEESEG